MSKIKLFNRRCFPVLVTALSLLTEGANADDWKSVAEEQLRLQVLTIKKDIAEMEKKAKEASGQASTQPKFDGSSTPQGQFAPTVMGAGLPGPGMELTPMFPGLVGGQGEGPKATTPMDEKIRLVSIYGVDNSNLIADVLYGDEVLTISKDGSRGVSNFYGWIVADISAKDVRIYKNAKDPKGNEQRFDRTFVIRRANMTPLVGEGSSSVQQGFSPPPNTLDSTSRGGRFGIQRASTPPRQDGGSGNANSFTPGQPLPSSVVNPVR